MTLDEMLQAAREYHARGDAVGLYRFVRQTITQAGTPHEEGIARTLLADVLIRWSLGTPATIQTELNRARRLLKQWPDDLAYAVFVQLLWRAGENDMEGVHTLRPAYERLCADYPDNVAVQRWRGRLSQWLGRLELARGNLAGATQHFEQSLSEFLTHEPDPGSREQLIRMSKLRLAEFALMRRDLSAARRYLDECEGSTISRLWETIRACTEVQYAILTGNLQRARFWMKLAQDWATPQSEASTTLTLTQARLSYALGETQKARLLNLEARRLAAENKQDHLLPEIREFFRVQASGEGAGQLMQGGLRNDESFGSLAAAGLNRDSVPGRSSRR